MTDATETLEKTAETTAETVIETKADDVVVETKADEAKADDTVKADDTTVETKTDDELPEWIKAAGRDDPKRIERLKRMTDPGALLDSYLSLEAQMSKRGVTLPGEKATEDELKAFAKQAGVPEKPEDYKIKPNLPEGYEYNDQDKEILGKVTADFHKRGGILAHPQVIQAVHEAYAAAENEAQAMLVARATELHTETQAALDKEYGAEKGRNLAFGKSFVERFADPNDPDEVKDLFQLPLMNGAKLGDYLPFVRMMARAGREFGDDPLFAEIGGASSDTISTLEAEKAAIMKLHTDGNFREYDAKQDRLAIINDALARQARKKS